MRREGFLSIYHPIAHYNPIHMNLNQLFLWMVCLSCLALLVKSFRFPKDVARGWTIVSVGILAIVGLALYLSPAIAGWVGGGAWMLGIVLPLLGLKQVDRLCLQERYDRASRWAKGLGWLHPTDGWVERAELLRALALAQRGDFAAAGSILNRYRQTGGAIGRSATAMGYALEANWVGLLDWFRHSIPPNITAKRWELANDYLRALGETGDLNGLLEECVRWETKTRRTSLAIEDLRQVDRMRLYGWAFCGRVDRVAALFERWPNLYSSNTRQFWLATAQMVARGSQTKEARHSLIELQKRADGVLERAISWRLSTPLADPQQVLVPSSEGILWHWETRAATGSLARMGRRKGWPKATYTTIALNSLFFVVEMLLGGSQNNQVLYRLGALVPEVVWLGEWWRLLSATFLHFGATHLAMNMLGLYFLGTYVELALGMRRFMTIYLVSGVGSMLVTTLLTLSMESGTGVRLVVGASGAVMGLMGAIAAIFLQGWRQHKAPGARDRLRAIGGIVAVQMIFDLMNPQICFICHLSGMVLGFSTCQFLLWIEQK